MKIKILYPIGTYFPSQEGGPSNSVYWLCEGLKQEKNVFTEVVTTSKGIYNRPLDEWINEGNNSVIYTNSKGYFPLKMLMQSIKRLRNADVVHLTSLFYPPSFILMIINTIFYRKKMVVSVRGELNNYALTSFKALPKKLFLILWKSQKSKIYFHSTAPHEENSVKAVFGNKIKSITLPNFMIFSDTVEFSAQTKYDKGYFLYLGRLHKIKALENLIKALSFSKGFLNSPRVLKIAGDGDSEYKMELVALIDELNLNGKIEFLGHVEGDDKNNLLAKAFFLILPSHSENFGNVIVEALSHSTPVIASKVTPWKILEDNNCGYWVSNKPESLSKIIDEVIGLNKTEYMSMTKNAFDLAQREYSIYNNSYKWESFYQSLF